MTVHTSFELIITVDGSQHSASTPSTIEEDWIACSGRTEESLRYWEDESSTESKCTHDVPETAQDETDDIENRRARIAHPTRLSLTQQLERLNLRSGNRNHSLDPLLVDGDNSVRLAKVRGVPRHVHAREDDSACDADEEDFDEDSFDDYSIALCE